MGAQFADGAFVGMHGSWNREVQVGYNRVRAVPRRPTEHVVAGYARATSGAAHGTTSPVTSARQSGSVRHGKTF